MPQETAQDTVLTRYLATLVDAVTDDYGIEEKELFSVAGVASFKGERVSERDAEALWVAAEGMADDQLGLKVGSRVRYSSYASLGHLLVTSPTVGDALRAACDFTFYVGAAGRLHMETDADICRIHYQPLRPDWRAGFLRAEAILLPMVRFARWAAPGITPLSVCLMRPKPDAADTFEQAFCAPVHFGARRHEMTWSLEALARPMTDANPALNDMLRQHVEAEIPKEEGMVARVSGLLEASFEKGNSPTVKGISRLLGQSERSLQRALAEGGQSFRDIAATARCKVAERYLGQGLAVSEVAIRLGYSEPAAFIRAFRKWTGQTPAQWRRQGHKS
ncbi:MAG: AraC family transcriptional regulator [Alphaproteobacteria bacterium]|nr:AraC family transcriptional regulator [Alphaproteobacteria bacterium]